MKQKLFNWRTKSKWIDKKKAQQKGLYNSELYWALPYFKF